jgi:hypothetical protein
VFPEEKNRVKNKNKRCKTEFKYKGSLAKGGVILLMEKYRKNKSFTVR